jgi:hypothetical protein
MHVVRHQDVSVNATTVLATRGSEAREKHVEVSRLSERVRSVIASLNDVLWMSGQKKPRQASHSGEHDSHPGPAARHHGFASCPFLLQRVGI